MNIKQKSPEWIQPNVTVSPYSNQAICRELLNRCWLTNPIDARVGDTLVFKGGKEYEIMRVSWQEGKRMYVYEVEGGVGVISAQEVNNRPDVVIE